jgi:hypothetical protein
MPNIVFVCICSVLPSALPAASSKATPLHQSIDAQIAVGNYSKQAAPICTDAEFLRRVTLDLTGAIPTAAQTRTFLDDKSADKRARKIDALLASAEYARHMTYVVDSLLMDRRPDKHVTSAEWQKYLRESFAANKPYDVLVREILSADGADAKNRAPARFLLDRDAEPHQVTRDISRVFLGMNLTCCQCHDHPNVSQYKQDHYYGILAFLARTQVAADVKPTALGEKADGDTTFTSVFDTAKVIHTASLRLPSGNAIAEPKSVKGKEYKVAPAKGVRPIPNFSRRAQLGPTVVASRQFARTTANRLWALMMGRGLIHPVEYDHAANPPSHPKLLDQLTDALITAKFDLRWMFRELALSATYQRASAWPTEKEPDAAKYLTMSLKPLHAEQLAWSLMQATDLPESQRNEGTVRTFVGTFAGRPGEPAADFQVTLEQTLFVANARSCVNGWPGQAGWQIEPRS